MKQGQMGVSAMVSAWVSARVSAWVSAWVSAGVSAGISAMEVRRGRGVQAQNNKYIKCLRYITIFLFRWGFGLTQSVIEV